MSDVNRLVFKCKGGPVAACTGLKQEFLDQEKNETQFKAKKIAHRLLMAEEKFR